MLKNSRLCRALCSCALSVSFSIVCMGADNVLTRQMAAEIVEQAATTNAAYASVLRDVGKALRSKEMSVSDAKDLLSLAASCQQLGATHPARGRAPTYGLEPASHANGPTRQAPPVDQRPPPPQLDIEKLLDEEMASAGKQRESLFKGLDEPNDAATANDTSSSNAGGSAYLGGTAGRKLPWHSDTELERAKKEATKETERSELSTASSESVDASTLKKASTRVHGKVTMAKPGPDGKPQLALINIGSKNGLKDGQAVLFSRDGQALVKGVINRIKEYEAFALIIKDSWAASVDKEIKIGDTVSGL